MVAFLLLSALRQRNKGLLMRKLGYQLLLDAADWPMPRSVRLMQDRYRHGSGLAQGLPDAGVAEELLARGRRSQRIAAGFQPAHPRPGGLDRHGTLRARCPGSHSDTGFLLLAAAGQ